MIFKLRDLYHYNCEYKLSMTNTNKLSSQHLVQVNQIITIYMV